MTNVIVVSEDEIVPHSLNVLSPNSTLYNKFIDSGLRPAVSYKKYKDYFEKQIKNEHSEISKCIRRIVKNSSSTIYIRGDLNNKFCHSKLIERTLNGILHKPVVEETISLKDDGITHINVYSKGSTLLGRLLSNFANIPFKHPVYGRVETIEGLWYFLRTQGENYRLLKMKVGAEVKAIGRKLPLRYPLNENEFYKEIQRSIELKISSDKELTELVKNNSLPFVHYYVKDGKVSNYSSSDKFIEAIQAAVRNVKSKRGKLDVRLD